LLLDEADAEDDELDPQVYSKISKLDHERIKQARKQTPVRTSVEEPGKRRKAA
jgi:hypothetical protein